MLDSWLPFLIYGILALAIPASMIVMSFAFAQRPARRTRARVDPVRVRRLDGARCRRQRFTVSFYLTAMLFIVFDIEIVFLYPLAVQLHALGWFGFVEFAFFVLILLVAYVYIWRKGALELVTPMADEPTRLRDYGLQSERLLWPTKGPSHFEEELGADELERALGLTTLEKAVRWAQTKSMWPDTFGLACCAIEMMSIVSRALRHRALRDGGVPLVAAPGRPADRLRAASRTRWRSRCARSTTRCSSRSG